MFMKKFTAICILLLIPLCAFAAPLKSTATVTENKAIYLTFDDGPTDSVTPKVLDVLEKESVHATFFVIGKQISGREEILRRIAAQGHSVGVHSYSHCYKEIYADAKALLKDIAECRSAIRKVLRRYDKMIYRFPGGSFMRPDLRDAVTGAGYNYYDWNASAGDAKEILPLNGFTKTPSKRERENPPSFFLCTTVLDTKKRSKRSHSLSGIIDKTVIYSKRSDADRAGAFIGEITLFR